LTVALPLAAAFAKAMQGNRPEELYRRKAPFVIGNDLRDYTQRFGAWRGCELRNRLFSVEDKISCEK